ncbi:hypothetical protein KFE25_006264 [Diacronema lutheri]|uniref:Uncharacterized protein n=1 Tax=Diacronema lutheri TaxID=2081491 RepID=A0A8J6CEM2_DIALT|nr:hypothetical protein KFE25_006264 [Diacronema lutheri]
MAPGEKAAVSRAAPPVAKGGTRSGEPMRPITVPTSPTQSRPARAGPHSPLPAPTSHGPATPHTPGSRSRMRLERFSDIETTGSDASFEHAPRGKHSIGLCAPSCSLAIGATGWLCGASRRTMSAAAVHLAVAIFGLTMAFFGGGFGEVYAATEAFRNMGFNAIRDEVDEIARVWHWTEAGTRAAGACAGGSADELGESPSAWELLRRRSFALFAAVHKPIRLQRVGCSVLSAWASILATMRYDWARNGAIGVGIGNFIAQPLVALVSAHLSHRIFELEHRQWAPLIVETLTQTVGLVVAFVEPAAAASLYSAIAGGLLCARAMLSLMLLAIASQADASCQPGGVWAAVAKRVGSVDDSFVDDTVGYALATAGLTFQLVDGTTLQFPESLLLAPLPLIEQILEWQRTWVGGGC